MSLFGFVGEMFAGLLVRETVIHPTNTSRRLEDAGDALGDWYYDRSATEIYSREIPKAVGRAVEDVTYDWKKALKK